MRILQVIPYFHPAYSFGGPVRIAYQTSVEMARRGHDVTVYTTDARDNSSRLNVGSPASVDGLEVFYFRNISMIPAKMAKLFLSPAIISAARDKTKSFDVVHLHEYWTFQNIVLHHYTRRNDVPYVLQVHGSLPSGISRRASKSVYDTLFGHRLLKDASKVIALGPTETHRYMENGVPFNRIALVPNGIELSDYSNSVRGSFKKEFNIPEKEKIVLYLGRIHRSKGIHLLIKAYEYLTKNMGRKDTVLVLVGPDDGYLEEARALVGDLRLSKSVLFTGFVNDRNRLGALADAEVLVTPSFQGFPMTFLEACLAGTPIITTTLGDVLGWINGSTGFVTEPTVRDLARAIDVVISDDELHTRLSRNCRQIVRSEFSLGRIVDKIIGLYEEVSSGVAQRGDNQRL